MNLDGIIVSVDYADFLAETLPLNQRHFDRLVVVTSPEDVETQRVCDFWDCEVVLTDAFQTRWGEMHKSKGINAGLAELGPREDAWVLHLDADIVLPPRTRTLLDRAQLNRSCLYGADRLAVAGHDLWRAHQAMPFVQHDGYHVRLAGPFKVMARFNAWHMSGYAPPGYFQLWHPAVSGVGSYPAEHTEADRTDMLHAEQWDRVGRQLLPELAVYHLESQPSFQGTNWGGRKTSRWGAAPLERPDRSLHRRYPHHKHHDDRPPDYDHGHHHHDDDDDHHHHRDED